MSDEPPKFMKCSVCQAPNKPGRQGWTSTTYRVGGRMLTQVHLPSCPAGWEPDGGHDHE